MYENTIYSDCVSCKCGHDRLDEECLWNNVVVSDLLVDKDQPKKKKAKLCTIQSEPIEESSAGSAMTMQQTTHFIDEAVGESVSIPYEVDEFALGDAQEAADLSGFLSRPVRIMSATWNESDPVGTVVSGTNPWTAFFNNANIKYKLNNYAFIRCNLKLKFVINASPFYYGALRAVYQPMQSFKPIDIPVNANLKFLMPYSTLPGVWLSPQHSEGAEMTLPFMWKKNYLHINSISDFDQMGYLNLINYTALQSANGVSGNGITVQVYAWAEDVILSGPTLALALQSDEYGTGPVSGVASTVGSIAGKLKSIPVIGKFATATEMGAKAISGIAKLFGFTNVPVIEPARPYRPTPLPPLASAEIGFPVEKLTLDCKNELTIDPTTLAMPAEDPLAIHNIVQRQCYITTASWTSALGVDTPLFTGRVNPYYFDLATESSMTANYLTPSAYVAHLFNNWRGDMIFTFKFVASKYHKGRARISYDPYSSTVQTAGDVSSTIYNTIVDLGEETEVEFRVPYQQALGWLLVNRNRSAGDIPFSTSTTPTLTNNSLWDNGMISLKVLTILTGPAASANVPIMVFVRAADNFEVANTAQIAQDLSFFPIQSDIHEEISGEEVAPGAPTTLIKPERNRLNFGENVCSLRPLLRRSAYSYTDMKSGNTTSQVVMSEITFGKFPRYFGWDPAGWNSATKVIGSGFAPFNYTSITAYNWIAPAFLAQRGSAHWHFLPDSSGSITGVFVTRNTTNINATGSGLVQQATGSNSQNSAFFAQYVRNQCSGAAATSQLTNAGLSVSIPNMTMYKMQSTYPYLTTVPPTLGTATDDGSQFETTKLDLSLNNTTTTTLSNTKLHAFFGVGTDYSLYYFLCVPKWYSTTFPTPNPA